ncbi:hypothetical protein Hypma_016071 [Hypsizygus marmoreus]|uniref:Uncharacterized protein n=1 Tax=Hypsizygus marmoreus TaxID=39966 RepID=A0A369K7E8_HYPMA|nr:hypothetical protein Hypma_016071 [Hypsizygus marmoreus]
MRTCYPCFVLAASGRSFLSTVHAFPVAPEAPDIPEIVDRPVIAIVSLPSRSAATRRNLAPPSPITPSNTHTVFLTPAIIASLVLFIAFTALVLSLFFFQAEIHTFVQKLRHKKLDPELEKEAGEDQELQPELEENQEAAPLGFGFDGLNKEELDAQRRKEEKEALQSSLSIEIPDSPPSLVLKHHSESPLSPIRAEGSSLEGHEAHDIKSIQDDPSVPSPSSIDRAAEEPRKGDAGLTETEGKELHVPSPLTLSPTSTAVSEDSGRVPTDELYHFPALPFHPSESTATEENLR